MIELEILFADSRSFSDHDLASLPLSASSQVRLARLATPERRRQFLLGRLLMAQACQVALEAIDEGCAGYPVIRDQPAWQVSLSHSGAYVAAVAARGPRFGLDIELPSRERNWLALAERAFHVDELAWLQADPSQLRARFLQLWTVREAAYKAGLRPSMVGGEPVLALLNDAPAAALHAVHRPCADGWLAVVGPTPFTIQLRHLPG